MKERPILFSAPMVRALLDGIKTQTRRVVKLPHANPLGKWEPTTFGGPDGGRTRDGKTVSLHAAIWHTRTGDCIGARWLVSDRLWVREAWRTRARFDAVPPRELGNAPIRYEADDGEAAPGDGFWGKLRPSMFMPRWSSRITLEIVSVRVERLQDISEFDALAEGCVLYEAANYLSHGGWSHDGRYVHQTAIASYKQLWESINGEGAWAANPWVWAIEFKRIEQGT